MQYEPANLYTPNERDALIRAAQAGDFETIDEITDSLAQQGVCRQRDDLSRLPEWVDQRQRGVLNDLATQAAEAGVNATEIGAQIAQQLRGVFAGGA